ncbi:MAG TPA: Rid family detoxifying hydrolase [Solirubrobacteraceae bacterium]|nr:Rid family detoxifying hydrolase [Solirubrobacteraceae bacterium]
MTHHRHAVTAPRAPGAVGPYSHAVSSGGLLFCSGQLPIDPDSGELVAGTPGEQVTRCLHNLEAVCAAAGASLADAVRLTVYVTDMEAFVEVNDAYGRFFPEGDPPARVAVGVAALPLGAEVEVDAIAALAD